MPTLKTDGYQTAAVIFLDVLGTRDRTTFSEKFAVHRLFHEEVRRNEARQEQSPHVIYSRELRSFSDCVYILYTYKENIEECRKNDLNLLYTCLYNTSISLLRILDAGFVARGGATIGSCFLDELGFFGPAVEEAYSIESTHAMHPRVVLGDEVGKQLYEWERTLEVDDVVAAMFTEMPRLIHQDTDGRYFVNLFFELERSQTIQYGDQSFELDDLKAACLRRTRDALSQAGLRDDVRRKMEWLEAYLERVESKLNQNVASGSRTIVLGP